LEFLVKKVKELGLAGRITPQLKKHIEERLAFVEAGETPPAVQLQKPRLSDSDKELVTKLIGAIERESDADRLQAAIFSIAKSSGTRLPEFFKMVYRILFNADRGPRLGQYVVDAGKKEVIAKLKAAVEN
jgi:lysyl-tRNA synthetase class 1